MSNLLKAFLMGLLAVFMTFGTAVVIPGCGDEVEIENGENGDDDDDEKTTIEVEREDD